MPYLCQIFFALSHQVIKLCFLLEDVVQVLKLFIAVIHSMW